MVNNYRIELFIISFKLAKNLMYQRKQMSYDISNKEITLIHTFIINCCHIMIIILAGHFGNKLLLLLVTLVTIKSTSIKKFV